MEEDDDFFFCAEEESPGLGVAKDFPEILFLKSVFRVSFNQKLGTCFFYGRGWFITNHHVLPIRMFDKTNSKSELIAEFYQTGEDKPLFTSNDIIAARSCIPPATISDSTKIDLTFFQVSEAIQNKLKSTYGFATLPNNIYGHLEVGNEVWVLHFSNGDKNISCTKGKISNIENDQKFIHTAQTRKGASGCPVFQINGGSLYLIGLGFGGRTSDPLMNYAIPAYPKIRSQGSLNNLQNLQFGFAAIVHALHLPISDKLLNNNITEYLSFQKAGSVDELERKTYQEDKFCCLHFNKESRKWTEISSQEYHSKTQQNNSSDSNDEFYANTLKEVGKNESDDFNDLLGKLEKLENGKFKISDGVISNKSFRLDVKKSNMEIQTNTRDRSKSENVATISFQESLLDLTMNDIQWKKFMKYLTFCFRLSQDMIRINNNALKQYLAQNNHLTEEGNSAAQRMISRISEKQRRTSLITISTIKVDSKEALDFYQGFVNDTETCKLLLSQKNKKNK